MTVVTISSPLGPLNTTRDPNTGERLLNVDGVGVTTDGVVYWQAGGADAGEAAQIALDPVTGTLSAVKETT